MSVMYCFSWWSWFTIIDFTSSIVSSSSHTILELCQRKPLIDVLSTDGTIPENTLVRNISSS